MGICASLFCPCWGARLPYNSIDDDEDDDQDFVGGKGGYKGGCRHRYRQQQEQEQRPRQQPPGGQQPVGRPSPASYNTTPRTVPDSPATSVSGSGKAGPISSSGGGGGGGPPTNAGGPKGNRGGSQQQQGSGQGAQEQRGGFHDKYDLCDVIGVGSTSTVHRCVERATGKEFACKIIDKRMIETRFRGLLDQFQVEISVLKALDHPNIIHLADVFETEPRIYMVMELMRGGELFDYVVEKGTLSEEEASGVVRRLASAMAYMHAQEVIHRDLKPENLLLTHRGPDAEVRIIDFGLSKMLSNGAPQAKSFLGTRGYLAPEMLQRQTYSKTIDVWALGVIAFVLLCGCLPFDDDAGRVSSESVHQRFQLRFPSWASNLSTGAKDLLCHLLDINPRTRYTAEQACNHPWVQGRGNSVKANNYLQSPRNIRRIRDAAASNLSFPRNSNSGLNLAALAVTATASSVSSSTGGGAATSPPRASPSVLRSFSGQGPLGPPLPLHPSTSCSSLAAQAGGSYGYGYYQYQPVGSSPSTSSYHAPQPPQQHYSYAPPPLLPPAIPSLPASAAPSASASLPSPAFYHTGTAAYPPAPLPPFVGYPPATSIPMPPPPPGGGGARAEGPPGALAALGQSAGSHGSSSSIVYGGSPASREAPGYQR